MQRSTSSFVFSSQKEKRIVESRSSGFTSIAFRAPEIPGWLLEQALPELT